jgi:hypothetical protein
MLHSVAGAPPGWFPENTASKAKFTKPITLHRLWREYSE